MAKTREHGYSTEEVVRESGATYRIVDYWARTGVLRPSLRGARGSGSARRYSLTDLRIACVLNVLRQLGARRDVLATVADRVGTLDLADGCLYVSPLGEVTKDAKVAEHEWACLWCVNLDPARPAARLVQEAAAV